MTIRVKAVYWLLLVVWAVVAVWQGFEHHRVKEAARTELIHRARDITSTLGLVIRAQGGFRGIVVKPWLELALQELVKFDNLKSIALLNVAGEDMVSAGEPIDFGRIGMPQNGVHWGRKNVVVINPVDLGAAFQQDGTNASPIIVVTEPPWGGRRENRPRFSPPPFPPRDGDPNRTNNFVNAPPNTSDQTNASRAQTGPGGPPPNRHPEGRPPPGFRRPPWMPEDEYTELLKTKGLHGLAIVLSTEAFQAACTGDLWLRMVIGGFAAVSVVGFGFAWRTLLKSSEFQMRLVRASEMNSGLREMNVAAAGLAHETRNPLNIIRGLAQMIAKAPEAPESIRKKSSEITEEVDRVTVQLNEFINYSKPREVRRAPVAINTVVTDVVRTLKSDLEDKAIHLEYKEEHLTVSADQQLLRQVLFNLLMNAIQAVDPKGQIKINVRKTNSQEACFEVCDNGPGVPLEKRKEIFRPYFTMREKGTGLGLAVVKQIVMVHGWDIECLANEGQGALFRVSRLELTAPNPGNVYARG